MNTLLNAQWWHCYNDIEKNERIDTLCQQGLIQHCRVTILATPEQLISNLTVKENIELPGIWHGYDSLPFDSHASNAMLTCLQNCLRGQQTPEHLLAMQGARLNSQQRRWIGLARALHLHANYVVIDDDEKNPYPFEDERLQFITEHLPDAVVHWVSLRTPSALPEHWLFAESGVNT